MIEDERKRLAADLLPHLAEILHHSTPKVGQQTLFAWLQVVRTLDITLNDLINEIRRQGRQEGQQ